MAQFIPGTDTSVKAKEPTLEVLVSPRTPLKVGKHVFNLVVTDDSGNPSAPAVITIIVTDGELPTAVIDFIGADGRRIPDPQVTVPFGAAFQLTGERSSDVGGEPVAWTWTLQEA
jgi:hypothetical protein